MNVKMLMIILILMVSIFGCKSNSPIKTSANNLPEVVKENKVVISSTATPLSPERTPYINKIEAKTSTPQNPINATKEMSSSEKMRLLFDNYEKDMVKAVNENNFSIVEPFIKKDSALYNSQKSLVTNLAKQGIKEEIIDYDIVDFSYDYLTSNKYILYVHEKFNIIDTEENKNELKEFDYAYFLNVNDKDFGLYDIKKWDRKIIDSYLPDVKKGMKYIYSNGETVESIFPIGTLGASRDYIEKWNGVRLKPDPNTNYSEYIYSETEDGLYMKGLQSNNYRELKYPVKLNDEWDETFGSAGAGASNQKFTIHYKIISVNETVVTPYKTFEDVVVVQSTGSTAKKYFAKGYGLIRFGDVFLKNIVENKNNYAKYQGRWYASDSANSFNEVFIKGGAVLIIEEISKDYIKGKSTSIQKPPANRVADISFEGKLENGKYTFDFTDSFLNKGIATIILNEDNIQVNVDKLQMSDKNTSGWRYGGGTFKIN